MEGNERELLERFTRTHAPGITPGDLEKEFGPEEMYLGMKAQNLNGYLSVMSEIILRGEPKINYVDFEARLLAGVKKMDELAKRTETRLKRMDSWHAGMAPSIVTYYFYSLRVKPMPFDQQVRSFNLHAKLLTGWLRKKPDLTGEYHTHYSTTDHVDAPLVLRLTDISGKLVGTIGGLAYYDGKTPTIGITNIQGSGILPKHELESEEQYKMRQKAQEKRYKKINGELKENWRLLAMRKAIGHIPTDKFEIIGHPPTRHPRLGQKLTDSEYGRIKRQYDQTYRNTGFDPLPDGSWKYAGKK
ncbi:MAG: hypothetical protein V1835_04305 [Candidatus Micrarchaeota archaeon]